MNLARLASSRAPGSVVDVDQLVETRLLIQGASGSGKSTIARRLLEQTSGQLQQIILDPEGEFPTLRSVGDYLLCSADGAGDVLAEPKSAGLLARRIRETGVSAILDLYELKAAQRQAFVAAFLDGLMAAPKKYWRDALLFIDECHVFAPQARTSDSLIAVQDAAARGRKRRIGLICATQRLAKLHKDVAAECRNRLIGQTGLKNDLQAAADEMGLSLKEAREALVRLKAGEFYAFGPALAPEYTLFRAAMPKTKAATASTTPAEASSSLRKVIEQLADLPKEAEKERKTLADLRKDNAQLRRDVRRFEKQAKAAGVPEKEVGRRINAAIAEDRAARPAAAAIDVDGIRELAQGILDRVSGETAGKRRRPGSNPPPPTGPRPTPPPNPPSATAAPADGLDGPMQRILDAICWLETIGVDEPEQPAVAFLAGYRYGTGGYNNARSRLNTQGLVDYLPGKRIRLTDAGRGLANAPEIEPTPTGIHEAVLARLKAPEQRILRPLLEAYPDAMTNEVLAAEANYTAGTGGFNNPKGRLRTLGLIEYPEAGCARARDILFPGVD